MASLWIMVEAWETQRRTVCNQIINEMMPLVFVVGSLLQLFLYNLFRFRLRKLFFPVWWIAFSPRCFCINHSPRTHTKWKSLKSFWEKKCFISFKLQTFFKTKNIFSILIFLLLKCSSCSSQKNKFREKDFYFSKMCESNMNDFQAWIMEGIWLKSGIAMIWDDEAQYLEAFVKWRKFHSSCS